MAKLRGARGYPITFDPQTIPVDLDLSALRRSAREVEETLKQMESSAKRSFGGMRNAFAGMANDQIRQIQRTEREFNRMPQSVMRAMQQIAQAEAKNASASERAFAEMQRHKATAMQSTARESQRIEQGAFRNQDRTYRESAHAFDRAEREKIQSAERTASRLSRIAGGIRSLTRGPGAGTGESGFLPGLASMSQIIQGIPQIGQLAGALTRPLTDAAEAGIRYNMILENARIGLEGVAGSAQAAQQHIAALQAFAERTPFEFTGLLQASRYMTTFGFGLDEQIPKLTAWGNAVAASGNISEDALEGVVRAFGQMRTLGRVNAEEMNQLAERGIPAWDLLAKAIGRTVAETRKLGEAGRLRGREAVEAITAMMGQDPRFANQMERMSRTLEGRLSNLADIRARSTGLATQRLTQDINASLEAALQRGNLAETLATGINSAISPVSGLIRASVVTTLGGGITGGLEEGIRAGKDIVRGAVLDLATDSVLATFKGVLGIESPSRVFYDLGLMTAQGFALGLQEGGRRGGLREFTQEQIENARRVLEVGRRMGANEKQQRAAMSAVLVESNARNLNFGDRDSLGIFQQRPSVRDRSGQPFWGNVQQVRDIEHAARRFFEEAMRTAQQGTVGQLAQRVQRSAFPERYDQRLAEADRLRAAAERRPLPQADLTTDLATRAGQEGFGPFAPFRTIEQKDVAQSIYHTIDVLNKEREQVQAAYRAAIDAAQSPERYAEATRLQRMNIASPSIVSNVQVLTTDLATALARLDEQILAAHERLNNVSRVRSGLTPEELRGVGLHDLLQHGPRSSNLLPPTNTFITDIPGLSREIDRLMGGAIPPMMGLKDAANSVGETALKAAQDLQTQTRGTGEWFDAVVQESDAAAKQIESFSRSISDSFGDAFETMFRRPGEALKTLRQGFLNTLLGMGRDLFQSAVYKALAGSKSTTGNASEGGFLNLLAGGAKNLFGSGRNANTVLTGGFAGGSSPAANIVSGSGATGPTSQQLSAMIKSGSLATGYALGGPGYGFLGSGGGITAPQSLTRTEEMARQISRGAGGANTGTGAAATSAAAQALTWGSLFKGFGFGLKPGTGGNLSGIAPLLGLQLGMGLGGQSRYGQLIGGAGGLLLGAGITAAPSFLAGSFLAPLFSNPITAIAGGALLVGSLILSKNKQRRSDEQTRNQLMIDSEAQLREILRQVQTNRLDGEQGIAQAMQVRAQYEQVAGSLRDAKTRRIALADIYRVDAHVTAIRRAAEQQVKNQQTAQRLIPEFQHGGIVGQLSSRQMREVLSLPRIHDNALEVVKVRAGERVIPPQEQASLLRYGGIIQGADRGVDDVYMQATRGTVILNKQHQREIPQFQEGGVVGGGSLPRPSLESRLKGVECYVTVNNYGDSTEAFVEFLDSETGKSLIVKGMKSADGRKATLGTMKTMRRNKEW